MQKTQKQKITDFLINNGVIIVMFILVIYTGLTTKNFLTPDNGMNLLANMSYRLVIALGIAGCVITAGCDLSAGRMILPAGALGFPWKRLPFKDYSVKSFRGFTACYGGLRDFRNDNRLVHRLSLCTAFHCHSGYDGNHLRFGTFVHERNSARRIC